MVSNSRAGDGGSFIWDSQSENGHLQLTTTSQPVRSMLQMVARTTKAPLEAVLLPQYEGRFSLPNSKAYMDAGSWTWRSVPDPAGLGRRKQVVIESEVGFDRRIEGSMWWASDPEKETGSSINGSVFLDTTEFPTICKLMLESEGL